MHASLPTTGGDSLLGAALQCAGRGWRVLPLHSVRPDGAGGTACSCGRPNCTGKNRGKHPRIKEWQKQASTDPAQVCAWWTRWPDANIGIATGGGLMVVDLDGPDEVAAFATLARPRGMPRCPTVRTGRGFHLYLAGDLDWTGKVAVGDLPRDAAGKPGGILVRGRGGYVIAPPSTHYSGKQYQWVVDAPLPDVPGWMECWISEGRQGAGREGLNGAAPAWAAERPAFMDGFGGGPQVAAALAEWTPAEQARIVSALEAIPADCARDCWLRVGMALHGLGWEGPDGDAGLEMWDAWSRTGQQKYAGRHDLETCWKSFRRGGVTLGTLFHLAEEHGWRPANRPVAGAVVAASVGAAAVADSFHASAALAAREEVMPADQVTHPSNARPETSPPAPLLNGSGGAPARESAGHPGTEVAVFGAPLPAANRLTGLRWVDVTEDGDPKATCTNAGIALEAMGVLCAKDTFHERLLVGGQPIAQWAGDLSDDAVLIMRKIVKRTFGFDPGERNMRDAAMQRCIENPFNPVTDYLASLAWDGRERIGRWALDYLGAPDTPLNREVGRLMLIAAARRARHPGTKFDQIVVLEGREGTGKSTALKILAGADNFSDQHVLGASDREIQEAAVGVWIHEIAELAGMRRADVERVKAFASRTEDRARPAYGRIRVDMKRRGIVVGTTNSDSYLQSETGNRRFWPLGTGAIDLAGLTRDRDQLWAEAAAAEASGASIVLHPGLWAAASEVQRDRLEGDPWEEWVAKHVVDTPDCSIHEVLTGPHLRLQPEQLTQAAMNRVARILLKMGRTRYRRRVGTTLQWRYRA